ncbi:MAG: ribonuclease P protein subunit [Nanoarchaeota archaeon]
MKHEHQACIGGWLEITSATNTDLVHLKGKIIKDTMHTFVIMTADNKRKTILKNACTCRITA